jgi:hypothetical protein
VTTTIHGARSQNAKAPARRSRVGSARTRRMVGSKSACQMIRATGAARSGASAKVEPPFKCGPRLTTGHGAGAQVPGAVICMASQPFPHQPGPINSTQLLIAAQIAPVANRAAHVQADEQSRETRPEGTLSKYFSSASPSSTSRSARALDCTAPEFHEGQAWRVIGSALALRRGLTKALQLWNIKGTTSRPCYVISRLPISPYRRRNPGCVRA